MVYHRRRKRAESALIDVGDAVFEVVLEIRPLVGSAPIAFLVHDYWGFFVEDGRKPEELIALMHSYNEGLTLKPFLGRILEKQLLTVSLGAEESRIEGIGASEQGTRAAAHFLKECDVRGWKSAHALIPAKLLDFVFGASHGRFFDE